MTATMMILISPSMIFWKTLTPFLAPFQKTADFISKAAIWAGAGFQAAPHCRQATRGSLSPLPSRERLNGLYAAPTTRLRECSAIPFPTMTRPLASFIQSAKPMMLRPKEILFYRNCHRAFGAGFG